MKQKVALVLSGGGARGIAHIGVIEELEKQDYEITSIAGTSMGSLVGGVYALRKLEEFKLWICTLDKRKVFSLVDFALSKQGMIKGDRVLKKMKDFIPDTNIEDLSIPYVAVAADLLHKEEVAFSDGSIYEAIRASISIPTVLTPVKTEDRLLVDGGVMNNIPINQVKRTAGDLLVVVNVNANIPTSSPQLSIEESKKTQSTYQNKRKEFYNHLKKINPLGHEEKLGYFTLITKTLDLMTDHMSQMTLSRFSPDILINVSRDSCTIYDFYKAEEMIEIGRQAALTSIGAYKSKNLT
ncbi:MAG: patatin-like phospholipase family protein [Bacteroidales bacterium]|nr:patatin-like phospholipase family protein [Bacteroidales bacterium]